MKRITVFVALILISASHAQAAVAPQILMKGQSLTIPLEYEIGDVAVTDPGICDYLVGQGRRSIYLNARSGGETTITLWDTSGEKRDDFAVRVVTTTLKEALESVRASVGSLSGVNVEIRGGRVEISGAVADPEDYRMIEAISRSDHRVKSRVRITRDVIDKVADAIREAIDVPGVNIKAVRDRIVLEGVVFSSADKKRALEIAMLYTPDVLDLMEVKESNRSAGQGSLIELEFHLMEIKRSALRQLAFDWAPGAIPNANRTSASVGAGVLSSIGDLGRSLVGLVLNFIPKLRFIRERGDGRVLENPSIVVKSGEEAKIFSGIEVPYYSGEKVQFKSMGVEITANPIEVSGGVDLKLSATLSAPSADIRGSIDRNTVSTTAICPFGQSVVLGGIIRNGDVKMKNRVPQGLDTSSAIFTLFLSKDFQSNRSEFVIFVTPKRIQNPTSAEAELDQFLTTEQAMIKDRSRKELRAYLEKKDMPPDEKPKKKRSRRRRWR